MSGIGAAASQMGNFLMTEILTVNSFMMGIPNYPYRGAVSPIARVAQRRLNLGSVPLNHFDG